ncbi:MAG: molybdopterin-dependent oxidoreductase, partial [Planctomycetota bacterium]
SICEVSHHTGGDLLTTGGDIIKKQRSWRGKDKHHWKPDMVHADYIVWFGANPLEASFPMQALGRKLSEFLARGGKMAVVDPRYSNTAAKADKWLPVIPGTDAALALAMGRRIIANGPRSAGNTDGYDDDYLMRPDQSSAVNPNGDLTASDATWLVKTTDPKTYLTAEEAGLAAAGDDKPVVWSGGAAVVYDTVDTADLLPGALTVNLLDVKTAFELYKDRVEEKTIAEYATICGVPEGDITAVADAMATAWKKGTASAYRGPVQHTNGTHAMFAIMALNTLLGNYDWKGGNSNGGGHLHETDAKDSRVGPGEKTRDLETVPGGVSPSGVPISRNKKFYETDAPNLFARDGYPAKRPWTPFNSRWNFQEILPSIEDGYPYPIKALILYWANMLYSSPAGREQGEKVLTDRSKVPLLVVFDILVSETSQFADYLLPDTTWLERFSSPHVAPAILTSTSGVRQPLVGRFKESGGTYYYESPFSSGNVALDADFDTATGPQLLEDILIRLGKMIGAAKGKAFPGVGANAFVDGDSLESGWDYYRELPRRGGEHGAPRRGRLEAVPRRELHPRARRRLRGRGRLVLR